MSETRENGKPWWPEELITREQASGAMHTFIVAYREHPSRLEIDRFWIAGQAAFAVCRAVEGAVVERKWACQPCWQADWSDTSVLGCRRKWVNLQCTIRLR